MNPSSNKNEHQPTTASDPLAQLIQKNRAAIAVAVILIICCIATYFIGLQSGKSDQAATADSSTTLWTCSMHPQVQLPKFGQCPICFMDLIPLEKGVDSGPRSISMSREAVALADIQTALVVRRNVSKKIAMVGKVAYDETKVANITAWVPGRLDKLYIDYTGVEVKKGDHLGKIYSPELIVAQRELIQAWNNYQKYRNDRKDDLLLQTLKSTEEKLRLLGLTATQIETIKKQRAPSDHITIYSPIGGVVIEKNVNEGVYVKTGARIYTIADVSQVWVYMNAYESDMPWLRYGQSVSFTTETYPGKIFKGKISFIHPMLNEKTRTVKVRVIVPNTDLKLKPGMFIRAVVKSQVSEGGSVVDSSLIGKWISRHHPEIIRDGPGKCPICGIELIPIEEYRKATVGKKSPPPLVIPATAPLITGKRAVVYVKINPLLFHYDHILNWSKLFETLKIRGAAKQQTAAKRIYDLLGTQLKNQISSSNSSTEWPLDVKNDLVKQLNKLLVRRDLYDSAAWQATKRADEIKTLKQESIPQFTSEELQLVNRRLIEAALPNLLKKANNEPTFQGREVLLGARAGEFYIVRSGLSEGEKVVTSGNFKIDSALQIAAKPSMMNPPLVVSNVFRQQLAGLYRAYLDLQTQLGLDQLDKSRLAALALQQQLIHIKPNALDSRSKKTWNEMSTEMQRSLKGNLKQLKMADLRKRFEPLSLAMLSVIEQFGHSQDAPLFKAHCPMAFDNKGAPWLQASQKILNPYFGAKMLRCGSIQQTYRPVVKEQK